MAPDWERQELPLCFVLFPCGCAVPTEGGGFSSLSAHACRWGAAWCSMVCGRPSPVPAASWGHRCRVDPLGIVQVTYMVGTEALAANPRHRVACDVSPFPLFLGVSIDATVSLTLSWPGASQQNIGFLSEGMVITYNTLIIFPLRSGYLQLERISRALADLTLLTIINPFLFDSNQSLESF